MALRSCVLAAAAAAAAVLPLALAAGCTGSTAPAALAAPAAPGGGIPAGPAPGPQHLSETGSTLLFPLLRTWAAAYHQQHANVTISTAATGSGKGISGASAVLNLISRSGDATFVKDFQAVRATLGPGPGTLLSVAAGSSSGAGARQATAAEHDLRAWYAVIGQAYALDSRAQYTTETALVTGPGAGASTAGFARVEAGLSRAIDADHAVFHTDATAGRDAFTGLDAVIIAAALLMGAGCAWGLSRRLAEYR